MKIAHRPFAVAAAALIPLLLAAASTSFADVAHVGVLEGHAIVARVEGGNVAALRNMPLLSGDALSTASGALAEVDLAAGISLRLDGATRVQFISMLPANPEVRLLAGTIACSTMHDADAPQIDTPSITLRPGRSGFYRVTVAAGKSTIVVHRGELRVITPNGTQLLDPGEQVTIDGPPARPHLRYATTPPGDAFDGFNQSRDAVLLSTHDDLAPYGTWLHLKGYGTVWSPREFAGWAPYHSGRWLWRRGLGWTWISHESWGWRPYHYGTWLDDSTHGWCWVPPRSRAAWMPSNAIFFVVIVNGHTQSVGWVPLAPGEPYHSTLQAYRNVGARGGIVIASRAAFYSGNLVRLSFPSLAQIPGRVLLQAPAR
ncbi:MAG TPA: DUF6600 domain-containing protein [Candidatus Tyrphobacter sp.]